MKITPDIIERLKQINKESGLSQRKFSMLMGHSASAIHEIYVGRVKVLSQANISILEMKFGINPEWLETGKGPKKSGGEFINDPDEIEMLNYYRRLPAERKRMGKTVVGALYTDLQFQE